MYGADIGNLTVKTVTDSNQTMLWVRNGDQGTGWSKGSVEFSTMMNEKVGFYVLSVFIAITFIS